jgi:hypothetical protein
MILIAVIFAGVVAYCVQIIRRDEAAMRGMIDQHAKARMGNNMRWHKRAAMLSAVGLLVAVTAMLR